MSPMKTDIEERVAASLHQQAGGVNATPDLARKAYGRAHRLRLRRRIGGAVACLVALAIAVPIGTNVVDLRGGGRTEIAPSDNRAPRPRATPSAVAAKPRVKVSLDLSKLPAGRAPEVPWYAGGVIHDGARTTPVGNVEKGSMVSFLPVAGGYVVQVSCCERDGFGFPSTTRLIGVDGKVRRVLPPGAAMPVASGDGRTLVWSEPVGGDSPDSSFLAADAATGDERARTTVRGNFPTAVGFLRGLVAWTDDEPDGGVTGLWNPETGRVNRVEDLGQARATDGARRLLVTVDKAADNPAPCVGAVASSRRSRELWRACDVMSESFSADRRYVFGRLGNGDAPPAAVLDAATGRVVMEIGTPLVFGIYAEDGAGVTRPVVEHNGDLLVEVTQERRQALVRCSVGGRCERATDLRALGEAGGSLFALPGRGRS